MIYTLCLLPAVPAEAPDILYKSHYESPGNDDSGTTATGSRRKTRNSNGSRGVASRPGLRSQKIVKNDSEDEEGEYLIFLRIRLSKITKINSSL